MAETHGGWKAACLSSNSEAHRDSPRAATTVARRTFSLAVRSRVLHLDLARPTARRAAMDRRQTSAARHHAVLSRFTVAHHLRPGLKTVPRAVPVALSPKANAVTTLHRSAAHATTLPEVANKLD